MTSPRLFIKKTISSFKIIESFFCDLINELSVLNASIANGGHTCDVIMKFLSTNPNSDAMVKIEVIYIDSSKSENYDFEQIECNPDNEFLSVNSLGLNEEIFIYPNPSNDYIDINNAEEIWKLQIINMNGEKIDIKPSGSRIDVSFLSKGIYILNFNNNFIKFVKN